MVLPSGVQTLPQQPLPATQSLFRMHCLPLEQGGQVPPPQSTSVSLPFLMPSVQVAAAAPQTLGVPLPLQV